MKNKTEHFEESRSKSKESQMKNYVGIFEGSFLSF